MTASEDTCGKGENTGVGFDPTSEEHSTALNADAQTIVEYPDKQGEVTLDQFRGRTLLSVVYLKTILRNLKKDGYNSVTAGYGAVRIDRVDTDADDNRAVTDGGVTRMPVSIDLATRDIYRATCNRRRRQTMRILALIRMEDDIDIDQYVPVDILACAIVAARDQVEPEDVEPDARRSVYVTLVQTHLPLLDKLDIVCYHDRAQKVEATDELLRLSELLATVDRLASMNEPRADYDLFRDEDTSEWPGGQ